MQPCYVPAYRIPPPPSLPPFIWLAAGCGVFDAVLSPPLCAQAASIAAQTKISDTSRMTTAMRLPSRVGDT